MENLHKYRPPETVGLPAPILDASLPEQRFQLVEVKLNPLPLGEMFLANLDDEALDQLASAMALQGIAA